MTELLTPTLNDVTRAFHDIFPPSLAEKWDAAGLVVGRADAPVTTVGFAVDATVATAREAAEKGAGLLITHHPLLLRGASFLPDTDYKGEIVHTLIEAGCGLLGAHTNVDSAPHGTNEVFMSKLGITDTQILPRKRPYRLRGRTFASASGALAVCLPPSPSRNWPKKLLTSCRQLPVACVSQADPIRWFKKLPSAPGLVIPSLATLAHRVRTSTSPQICATTRPQKPASRPSSVEAPRP